MKLSKYTRDILIKHNVSVDLEKDYTEIDYVILLDKIVQFLDKKITRLTQSDIPSEVCSENLEELAYNVEQEFETLGPDGVFEKYTIDYLLTLHQDACYTIVSTIVKVLRYKALPVDQKWKDIVANYGKIPNIYKVGEI